MLINHYGMHWERYTFIEKSKYRLLGIPFGKGATHKSTDFSEYTACYVLEDRLQKPVYVGHTAQLAGRIKQHVMSEYTHNSWDYFSWFAIEDSDCSPIDLAKGIEAILTRFLNPRLNRKEESLGTQYWQTEESIHTLDGFRMSMIEKIYEKIKSL